MQRQITSQLIVWIIIERTKDIVKVFIRKFNFSVIQGGSYGKGIHSLYLHHWQYTHKHSHGSIKMSSRETEPLPEPMMTQ